jgi:non-homologous end joining protein Ku
MRQIRTPDGIWKLPETINTDDLSWLKTVNEALTNLKRRAAHRVMVVLNNYVEVVMHTNVPPEKYRQVMNALDGYKDEPLDVTYMPLMKQYIIDNWVATFNDSLFEDQIQERIMAHLNRASIQHAA